MSLLQKSKKIDIQPYKLKYSTNIFWVYGVLLKKGIGISRDEVVKKLMSRNIQTRNFFFPMHRGIHLPLLQAAWEGQVSLIHTCRFKATCSPLCGRDLFAFFVQKLDWPGYNL